MSIDNRREGGVGDRGKRSLEREYRANPADTKLRDKYLAELERRGMFVEAATVRLQGDLDKRFTGVPRNIS